MNILHKNIFLILLAFLTILFLSLRIPSIMRETVPYTYDQGRDFLVAKDIVVDHNVTLIGPTTGAQGVFHGAWWYYFLAVPFILTNGNPQAFYYFITFVALAEGLALWYFIRKEFGELLAAGVFAILAVSPYFVRSSTFAINSILTMPFIIMLTICSYLFMKDKKLVYLFGIACAAGMIAEAEVAFGIFLFPSLVLTVLITRNAKLFFGSVKKWGTIFLGVLIPTSLRLLFELKNGFLQTKSFLAFRNAPGTEPQTWFGVFHNRFFQFRDFYQEIFPDALRPLGWLILIIALAGLFLGFRKFSYLQKHFTIFTSVLVTALFFVSLIYKQSFFWAYYLEGIHYFFIILLVMGIYGLTKVHKNFMHFGMPVFITILILFGLLKFTTDIQAKEENTGLHMHTVAVTYLYDKVQTNDFCLKMYTPPVLTHTYNYLLDRAKRTQNMAYPKANFVNNECWYFIESDSFKERRDNWLKSNIPAEARMLEKYDVSRDLSIQKWSISSE